MKRAAAAAAILAANAVAVSLPRIAFGALHDMRFALLLVLASLFCAVDLTARGSDALAATRGRSIVALETATAIALLATFWIAQILATAPRVTFVIVGCALMLTGCALRFAAIRTLGAYFVSELQFVDGQQRIRRGVYRWITHPSELGLLLVPLGAAILTGSVTAALMWLGVVVPLTVERVRRENAFLRPLTPAPLPAPRGEGT